MTGIKVMRRAAYDADNDGKVDQAEALTDGTVIDGGIIEEE